MQRRFFTLFNKLRLSEIRLCLATRMIGKNGDRHQYLHIENMTSTLRMGKPATLG